MTTEAPARAPLPWRALLALVALWAATGLDWTWPWGILFLVLTWQSVPLGETWLVEAVSRRDNPVTYWAVMATWFLLSLGLLAYDFVPLS